MYRDAPMTVPIVPPAIPPPIKSAATSGAALAKVSGLRSPLTACIATVAVMFDAASSTAPVVTSAAVPAIALGIFPPGVLLIIFVKGFPITLAYTPSEAAIVPANTDASRLHFASFSGSPKAAS